VAGFDETGFRVDGRLHWVHCARTGNYTLLMVHPKRGTKAMNAMGVLPSFAGIAVHDAWAPYDTYTGPDHQLCCAHALRELQAVTDAAPTGQWCWAAQAAEALTAMQDLVSEAISQSRHAADPVALATQIRLLRSAALAGASQTAARSGALMTTDPNATSGWPSSGRKYPAPFAPSPAPASSARYAATYPPPPNTASATSTPSSCSPKTGPGRLPPPDRTTTNFSYLTSYERRT
jgi:Transposase IS66 family